MRLRKRFKRMSLDSVRMKLLVSFLFILLLPSLSIGGFSYLTAKNQVDAQLQSLTEANINLVSHMIDQYIQAKATDLHVLSQQASLQEQIQLYLQTHSEIEGITLKKEGQLYRISSSEEASVSSNTTEQSSGYTLSTDETITIGEPYTSEKTGNTVVELTKTWETGQTELSLQVTLTQLQQVIGEIEIGNNGFVVVFSASGASIVEPPWGIEPIPAESDNGSSPLANEATTQPMEQTPTPIEGENMDAQPQMLLLFEGNAGQIEQVSPEGDTRSLIYITNELTSWKIAGDRSPSEVTTAASPIWNNTLLVIGLFSLVGALLIIIIVRSITKPLQQLTTVSQIITQGNLQHRAKVQGENEFAKLAQSFNKMVDSLSSIVGEVSSSSDQLAASSEQLSASAEQSASATGNIVTVIEQMTDGANQQVQLVNTGIQSIQNVSGSIEQIISNVQVAVRSTQQVASDSTEGGQAMKDAMKQMNSINISVEGLSEVIVHLVQTSIEIEQIIEVITNISQQTNLLALNAAIEAARAGEQGKGFAVVSSEIRKLAEQSTKSSEQVTSLVLAIRKEIGSVEQSMKVTSSEVSIGKEIVHAAGELFTEIDQSIHQINRQVNDVAAAAAQIGQETRQVVTAIEDISMVSEQTASGAEIVSAATEQQLASMEEISSSASYLTKMAVELQVVVDKFKI